MCRYMALWPHSVENESYDKPAGIYVLQLPFADEIQSVEDAWLKSFAKLQAKVTRFDVSDGHAGYH